MKVLIFAGTYEGRQLADWAAQQGFETTVSVATAYGSVLMDDAQKVMPSVLTGRMDEAQMEALFLDFDLVIDATHPYADVVTENIRIAAERTGIPCIRLLRRRTEETDGTVTVRDAEAAARFLDHTEGPVLLTTGSKEIDVYTTVADYIRRLYVRVLPSTEAIRLCRDAGIRPDHIIAMQGPFQEGLNREIMKQFGIRTLVLKDSGEAGGTSAKLRAAASLGIQVVMIRRPLKETGLSEDEVRQLMTSLREKECMG